MLFFTRLRNSFAHSNVFKNNKKYILWNNHKESLSLICILSFDSLINIKELICKNKEKKEEWNATRWKNELINIIDSIKDMLISKQIELEKNKNKEIGKAIYSLKAVIDEIIEKV